MDNHAIITTDKAYRTYPINNGNTHDFRCYTKTLEQIIDQIEYETINHSKALFIRIDIRNQKDIDKKIARKDMTRIVENAKRDIERKHKNSPNKPDPTVTWTTEKDGDNPHYHCLIGVNGNAIQNGYSVLDSFNKAVKKHLDTQTDGLVHFCHGKGECGKMIDRNSDDYDKQMDEVVYIGSYLAKTNTKENRPKGARISSTSRLPENWKDTCAYKELQAHREAIGNNGQTATNIDCNKINHSTTGQCEEFIPDIYPDKLEEEFSIMAPPLSDFTSEDFE